MLAKDLTLTAAPGASVEVTSVSGTTLLQPPNRANVVGLRFRPVFWFAAHHVQVIAGHVAFSDCVFEGRHASTTPQLLVQNAHVAMQRCTVYGQPAPAPASSWSGSDAARVVNASLSAVDSTFVGGDLHWDLSGIGGHAIVAANARLHLVRCNVLAGGNSALVSTYPAGNGLQVVAQSHVWLADSLVRGGDGHATVGSAAILNLGSQPVMTARCTIVGGPGTPAGPATVGAVNAGPLLGHGSTTTAPVLGTTWTLDYLTLPTTPVLALWSDRLEATVVPVVAETAWHPLAGIAIAGGGVTNGLGALGFVFPLPAVPSLLHRSLFVQSIAGTTLPLEASPPVGGVLR